MDQRKTNTAGTARARKLKNEADNCVALAIRESDAETAALLIDEAAKLARRVRELTKAS